MTREQLEEVTESTSEFGTPITVNFTLNPAFEGMPLAWNTVTEMFAEQSLLT